MKVFLAGHKGLVGSAILRKLKVDFVFLPNNKDIYDSKRKIKIKIPKPETRILPNLSSAL